MHWLPYYITRSSSTVLPAFNRASLLSSSHVVADGVEQWLNPVIQDRFQLANRALQFQQPSSFEHLTFLWPNASVCALRLYCLASQLLQSKHAHELRKNVEQWYVFLDQTQVNLCDVSTTLGEMRAMSSHKTLYMLADTLDPIMYYVHYDNKTKKFVLLFSEHTYSYEEKMGRISRLRRVHLLRSIKNIRYRAYSEIEWSVQPRNVSLSGLEDLDILTDAILCHEWTLASKHIPVNWLLEDKGVALIECLRNLYNSPKYFFMSSRLYDDLLACLPLQRAVLEEQLHLFFTMHLPSRVIWTMLWNSSQHTTVDPLDL